MPPSTRRARQPPASPPRISAEFSDSEDSELGGFEDEGTLPSQDDLLPESEAVGETELDGDMEEGEEGDERQSTPTPPPLPLHLKEISSLASWTVSSAKPGCSIPQLLAPSTSQYWQSDGPQPHHLNIHFFKLVEIVAIRVFLDFELDESYTPQKIEWAAGMGPADLLVWSTMRVEMPRGWCWVDFSGVDGGGDEGGMNVDRDETERVRQEPAVVEDGDGSSEGSYSSGEESEEGRWAEDGAEGARRKRRRHHPTLRCMLLQVRIIENHQNGKDTHLRGLQIFARDPGAKGRAGGNKEGVRRGEDRVLRKNQEARERRGPRKRREPVWDDVPDLR